MKVEFRHVTGCRRRKKFYLQDISFTIREGYITGIVGKNGAGKTTLFHMLLDRQFKYRGEILADGAAFRLQCPEIMNRIGFVSDEHEFFMRLTAQENVELMQPLYTNCSVERFLDIMKEMKLSPYKQLAEMSRGEYIKFQMAFAMAHGSELYLLDEATAGMDPVYRKEFFRLLHDLLTDEKCAVLMSTHIEDEVSRHMDYVVELAEGRIISEREVQDE